MTKRNHGKPKTYKGSPRRPGYDDTRYRRNREILKQTGTNICAHCGYPIDLQLKYPHPLSWSADHRTPRAHLTPDDPRHYELTALLESHLRCNEARGAKPLTNPTPHTPLNPSIDW